MLWSHIDLARVTSLQALGEDLERLRTDGGTRVVLLTGDAFDVPDAPRPGERLRWLELFELPLVYAWEGQLAGAAFDVALACDIRVCASGASLRATSIGTPRLLRLISQARAVELMERRMRL